VLEAYDYSYGQRGHAASLDPVSMSVDLLSLIFVVSSLLVLLYLVLGVRTIRSFQFEMFVFALVVGSAEVPRIALDISGLNFGVLNTYGLEVHTASMVILAGFVAYRIYGFFGGKTDAIK
jgi:hypothetical protein